jgi:putative pyruvate formate lyase activating enzyme
VNRLKGELGFCRVGADAKVFGAHAHYGEEAELVPSATLFFAGCTMRCVYCQNAPESMHPYMGEQWSEKNIATWIERMHAAGCKNVNFVGGDPTPFLYNILRALELCNTDIAVVYNSNAYYSEKTAELLRGVVDVYLLDFRYFSNKCAERYSAAPHYCEAAQRNMLAAVEDAELLIRLLVMPSHVECCAKPILEWIASNLPKDVRLNIMDQYRPMYMAYRYEKLSRPLRCEEYVEVVDYAHELGLKNLVS